MTLHGAVRRHDPSRAPIPCSAIAPSDSCSLTLIPDNLTNLQRGC